MIIIEPIITEKSIALSGRGRYVFKVSRKATKNEIKKSVASTFNVKVEDVNVINRKAKYRRIGKSTGFTSSYKKAIVSLKKGEKIKEFESKG